MMIWGHRGHRHHRVPDKYYQPAYENSLQAYREALTVCMGLECDVIQSRQGTIFLAHDTLFDGMVHYELKVHLDEASKEILGNRFIYQLNDDEISKLRLKDGQPIPQLRQLFEMMPQFPGRVLNLELKGPHTVDITVRAVEKAIQNSLMTPEQIVFSSFNFPALRHLRNQVGTRFKIGVLFSPETARMSQMYPNWPNAEQDAFYMPFSEENIGRSDIRDIQPDFFILEQSVLTITNLDLIERSFPDAQIILWPSNDRDPDGNAEYLTLIEKFAPTGKIHAAIMGYPEELSKRLSARGIKIEGYAR